MLQDWHSMYEFMHYFEDDYILIISNMNGMYSDSPKFVNLKKSVKK